ncbi:MAG: SDR family oxidoreductase [Oligoflexia bacterium]|nr:SDR family oxidoreductase [Oligoflexia bacterium]
MNILVTGPTGYIGGRLVPLLVETGARVRVLAREPRKLARRHWPGVEVFQGDVLIPETLTKALEGIEVAYYLVHSLSTLGGNFSELDNIAATNFARAAKDAGVSRIIYLGGLGITGPALSEHLRSRHQTGDALRSTGVPVTELRAAIIVGSGSASFLIIYDLVRKLPFMLCPRWVKSKCEPISIRQVMAYLVGVLQEPRTIGQVLEIGSGEILTYQELMEQCAAVLGRKLNIITVPVLTPRLSSYWLNLVTRVPISLARPLVEGLRNDVVCQDKRIRDWIKVPSISYREAVQLALSKMGTHEVESSWTDANTALAGKQEVPRGKPLSDERMRICHAPAQRLFTVIEAIGGTNGWYHADWLWQIRAAMDWLVGGVGMRRGRPDPKKLEVGDPIDFWRVEDIVRNRRLVLRAEMKLPGTARLTFEVEDKGAESNLKIAAHFWPKRYWGLLYWYTVAPLHNYVFEGLLRALIRKAENDV